MDDTEEEAEDEICIGYVQANIKGVQYYTGHVNDREMVLFRREPSNPYDNWAIRVNNVRGAQVGHVERYKACHLSPLIDAGTIKLEGVVPHGSGNKFQMPCHLYILCRVAVAAEVQRRLQSRGIFIIPTEEMTGGSATTSAATGFVPASRLTVEPVESELDSLLESLASGGGLGQLMDPAPAVATALFPHQKRALAWMVARESSQRLPPFWEVKRGTFLNTLTLFQSPQRPPALRGGCLCDDMGLGKTLSLLALIATCRPGVPLPLAYSDPQQPPPEGPSPTKKRRVGKSKAKPSDQPANETQPQGVDESAQPAPDGPRVTLIVCPLSVLTTWRTQLDAHILPGALTLHVYHGAGRITDPALLATFDIVLTTYNTLATGSSGSGGCTLQRVRWLRVILDEAHVVKNPAAQQTIAVQSLTAERRWVVTGTPIQNKLTDLYSLVKFLRIEPLGDRSLWQRTIERPVKFRDPRGLPRLRVLLSSMALRRTKDMEVAGRRLVELPKKTIIVQRVELPLADRQLYDQVEMDGRQLVSGLLHSGTLLQNYASVLEVILRLRQICDHPELASNLPEAPPGQPEELVNRLLNLLRLGTLEDDCPVCLSPFTQPVITICAHIFCKGCILRVLQGSNQACPMCRAPLNRAKVVEPPPEAVDEEKGTAAASTGALRSAKVQALISSLKEQRAADPIVKSVVFSQFTSMLSIAQTALEADGFNCVRLVGSLSSKQRNDVLSTFSDPSPGSPTVILISLKAGGVGLNLVAASRVYMMDPWWNWSTEEQAMDRVHRLGQTRDVEVIRLIVKDSIEERMLELQARKRELAKAALETQSMAQQQQRRIEDVQLLMQL